MSAPLGECVTAALDRAAEALGGRAVPWATPAGELAVAGHVAARAWRGRGRAGALRRAVVDAAVLGAARGVFGPGAAVTQNGALHPLSFLPDYHGAHFRRALGRLVSPAAGPFVVHLALTGACPWRCAYCYASAGGTGAPDLGDLAAERIAEELSSREVPIVCLGGGEPLARFARTERVVRVLARGCEVRLTTSGAGLTAERAARLREAGLRVVAVSLDGHDPAAVDAARGDGAWDAAVRAIRVSVAAGLVTLVTAVVGPGAYATTEAAGEFLAWARAELPGATVNFIPQFAVGRASGGGFRSPSEFAPVARRLTMAVRAGRHRAAVYYDAPMALLVGCVGAARRQAIVDINGNLAACVSGAPFGNLLREPFEVVWARMLAAPARFKRGYFCASVGDGDFGPGASAETTDAALRAFLASTEDALLQRAIDAASPLLAWMAAE